MKKRMEWGRRCLSLLMAAVFCVALLPMSAKAVSTLGTLNGEDARMKAYGDAISFLSSAQVCVSPGEYYLMGGRFDINWDEFDISNYSVTNMVTGEHYAVGSEPVKLYNLCLVDFDNDGGQELLAVYGTMREIQWSLWGFDGQKAVLLTTNTMYGGGSRGDNAAIVLRPETDGTTTLVSVGETWVNYSVDFKYEYFKVQGLTVSRTEDGLYGSCMPNTSETDIIGVTRFDGTYTESAAEFETMLNAIQESGTGVSLIQAMGGIVNVNVGNIVKYERVTITEEGNDYTLHALAQLRGRSIAEEIVSTLPYIGDVSKCRLTAAQAAAFAEVIEQRGQYAKEQVPRKVERSYFNAALFDAGDGIPALWLCGGYAPPDDVFYEDTVNEIWAWDGSQAVLDFQNGVYSRLTDRGIVYHGLYIETLMPNVGMGWDMPICYNSALFPLSHGRVSRTPAQTFASIPASEDYEEWLSVEVEQVRSKVREYDDDPPYPGWMPGLSYDFTTVTAEPFEEYDYSGYNYTFNGGTGTDGLNWSNTLLECERETLDRWAAGSSVSALLRTYAEVAKVPSYNLPLAEESNAYYQDVIRAVSGMGTIQAIYRLTDDMYYVLLENQGVYTGAVVRGVTKNGQPTWEVSQVDQEPAQGAVLDGLISLRLSSSNLTPDYGKLRGSPTAEELTAYLGELLDNYDGLTPNDVSKAELAAFVDSAVTAVASGSVSGRNNRLTLNGDAVSELAGTAQSTCADLIATLNGEGVTLNKAVTPQVRLLWQDLDTDQALQITVDQSLVSGLNNADLQLLLGGGELYIQFSHDDLRQLVDELGTFSIQISRTGDNTYTVNILDKDGDMLDSLSSPIILGLPASSMTSTVMVSYIGGSDNWGGQYDEASGVLAFETRYSGQYEVLDNDLQISDIAELSEESQAAIRFMVSKGYFTLDENGLFDPGMPLTRYDFAQTLVSMFFALDRSLTASFIDVPLGSGYYAYVASAEANHLMAGIEGNRFAGEDNMSVEQMLTVTGRTLAELKGYTVPEDAEQYLSSFEDGGSVSDWAQLNVALSVREGLRDRGGRLEPLAPITREQAAVTLYRLFLKLYEVPPVSLDLPPESAPQGRAGSGAILGVAAVVVVAGAGTAFVIWKKKKAPAGNK